MNNRMNAIEGEVWKPVVGYESRYLVSNMGRVFSLIKDKMLSMSKLNTGYLVVTLYDGSTKKNTYIHRIVAQAFLDNPNNLPEVNHKDEDKSNNMVDNLEWCTSKYNSNFGTRTTRLSSTLSKKKTMPIGQYDTEGHLVKVFPDKQSFEGTPYHRPSCVAVAHKGKKLYGYYWKMLNVAA